MLEGGKGGASEGTLALLDDPGPDVKTGPDWGWKRPGG